MDDVGKFYGRLIYFTAILRILWPFGKFYGYLVYFSRFGILYQEKIWQPCIGLATRKNHSLFLSTGTGASRDRFYKTPIRPKTFRTDLLPKILGKLSP
jgi:hypothetical protein